MKNATIEQVMNSIEKSTKYLFVYDKDINTKTIVSVDANAQPLTAVLDSIFVGTPIVYKFNGTNIILTNRPSSTSKKQPKGNTVSGKVIDKEGLPLPGVTVWTENNPSLGTTTDNNGLFNLKAKPSDILVFSCIGYEEIRAAVGKQVVMDVKMQEQSLLLDEVVVVGYDVQKKVNLTGAVSSISDTQFANKPITQASTLLQGIAAGVTVTTGGGAPGADDATIRIRGLGTFGGSSAAPLVLIDGVQGSIDDVDASQIDKISILKDAASSAIYGSRAANGVILVTTKRGSEGKASLTYNTYIGWQTPTTLPKNVNATEYMILSREATENDGGTSIYTDDYISHYLENNYLDPDNYPIIDWQKRLITGNGFTQDHNIALNASSGKIKFLTSFGYLDQGAIIKYTDYHRYSLRNNIDADITDKLHFRIDLSGTYGLRHQNPYQNDFFSFSNARDPLMLAQWSDGNYAPFTGGSKNILPMAELNVGGNVRRESYNLNIAASLTYNPFQWLTLTGTAAPRFIINKTHSFKDLVTYYSDAYGTVSPVSNESYNSLSESQNQYYYENYQFTAMYHKILNGNHSVKVLLGTSKETMDEKTLSAYRQDFAYPQYDVISAGGDNEFKDNGGAEYRWDLLSFFGRINYDYKSRYLFEANLRYDGSSRFSKGNRWGTFPSFSGAWRISQEPFMSGLRNAIDEFKIRASYGQLGNQNIGSDYYPTVQSLTISSISANNIVYPIVGLNSLANKDITWETTEMYDLGIDATLWKYLTITADGYYKKTSDILMELDIPSSIGLSAPYQNAGIVRNIGWEVSAGYQKTWHNYTLGVTANLSDVHNKIIDMKGTTGGSGAIRNQEGSSINSLFGLKCIGMARSEDEADNINLNCPQFNTTTHAGDLIFEDFDQNGIINDNDRQIIGSSIPRYTYGFMLNQSWKGLSLSLQIQGVGKADAYISGYYTQPCVQGGTFRKEHLDRWTPENTNAKFPRLSYSSVLNTKVSSFWMADASYCRLKNLQISYTLPDKICKNIKWFKSIMAYANATNLFTLTNYYQGYDPETTYSSSATDGVITGAIAYNYPLVKTFTIGLEVKF